MTDWCAELYSVITLESGRGLFSDCGAWHGYCLAGDHLEVRELVDLKPVMRIEVGEGSRVTASIDRIEAPSLRLGFTDSRRAFLEVHADTLEGISELPFSAEECVITTECGGGVLQTRVLGSGRAEKDGARWILRGGTTPFHVIQSFEPSGDPSPPVDVDPARVFEKNRTRWNRYLEPLLSTNRDPAVRHLLARCIATLIQNWRSPSGGIRHAGVIPSPFAYRGFWAWDSWKHARALALFAPDLAKDQVRAMCDHQLDDGMVPDTVMFDPRTNNLANTKPPLAAWAFDGIFAATGDRDFVSEFIPALLRYDAFWEKRRHDGAPLYSWGGAGETEARWESGWDNAARFDGVTMIPAHGCLLMNTLSVDLNAFLCGDKRLLADLCDAVGRGGDAARLRREADAIEAALRERLFDEKRGAFFDTTWPDGEIVPSLSAATWSPLWCGITTPEQAARVAAHILDDSAFLTPLPLPTVARSDTEFDPDGYWRGSVWIDQAAMGVEALIRYGYDNEARRIATTLLAGLARHDTFFECYNPLDGSPAAGERPAVAQFAWTAANVLLMLQQFDHGSIVLEEHP